MDREVAQATKPIYNVNAYNELRERCRLSYMPYFFCQPPLFFFHNKWVDSTFSHDFSDKQKWVRNGIWKFTYCAVGNPFASCMLNNANKYYILNPSIFYVKFTYRRRRQTRVMCLIHAVWAVRRMCARGRLRPATGRCHMAQLEAATTNRKRSSNNNWIPPYSGYYGPGLSLQTDVQDHYTWKLSQDGHTAANLCMERAFFVGTIKFNLCGYVVEDGAAGGWGSI